MHSPGNTHANNAVCIQSYKEVVSATLQGPWSRFALVLIGDSADQVDGYNYSAKAEHGAV